MKQLLLLFLALLTTSIAATEISPEVKELNATLDQLIAPVRDTNTEARIEFTDIQTDAERALNVSMKAYFKKTGPANFVEFRLDDLSYAYGDGKAPRTTIKAHFGSDLTQILPQEQINRLVPDLEAIAYGMAANALQQYGQAAKISFEVLDRTQNEAGHYVALTAKASVTLDLNLLPQSVKPEGVLFTHVEVEFSADVKKGLTIQATLISNPLSYGFQKDNEGLKQALDRILARDQIVLSEIQKFFVDLNEMARRVAHGQGF